LYAVNPNYTKVNAAEELKDPDSPYGCMDKDGEAA
jgi:hypothetical protein